MHARLKMSALGLGAGAAALAAVATAQPMGGGAPAITPLTRVGPGGEGYLSDPQPIRTAPSNRGVQYLSGTTKAVIACAYPLRPGCFSWRPIHVDAAGLQGQMAAAGVAVTNIQNVDIFQGDEGGWHAVVTIGVRSASHPDHWTVMAHAHPTEPGQGGAPPTGWTADRLLTGAFDRPEAGNYDGKYYEEDGRLYLLYVRNAAPRPQLRNEIVLQPMASPVELAGPPRVLLSTGDRYGPLASEVYANTQARLVEAPYITVINGKHALVYSTGAYQTPGYKTGVAWSDRLVPDGPDLRYRKVLQPDTAGVWGRPGAPEVRYLLQSERPRWPAFTGGEVIGPGVAAAVRGPAGAYWLFLNGFAPGDMPQGPKGQVDATHRRPFGVLLRAAVPGDRPVASVSDAELAGWLQAEVR